MFLSCLMINVGTNPDRPRPARFWLRNLYRVHQRLSMAFPSAKREQNDRHFVQPYRPGDFGKGQVHVGRSADAGFLFRVDPRPGSGPVILVQSASRPDWTYAFQNARHLLAADPQVNPFSPQFSKGQSLRFRLQVNPVRRAREKSKGANGETIAAALVGKRIPVDKNDAALTQWLERRAKPAGFRLNPGWAGSLVRGYVYVCKCANPEAGNRLFSVRFEGQLAVAEADAFADTLRTGIGPAKAFGFGLLSVAPV